MSSKQERTKPLTWPTHEVELDSIHDNPLPVRDIDNAVVARLAESFEVVGQLSPIALTTDRRVVFGRQRIAAQRARGESTIKAVFLDLPGGRARIATLDENLVRLDLTPFQRAELLAERKALHEQLHPGSQHGAALRGEGTAPGFTRAMSEFTGRGRSTIAEDVRIGQMPASVLGMIRGTPLEHQKTAMLRLAKLPSEDEQLRACQGLLSGSGADGSEASGAADLASVDEPDGEPEGIDPEDEEGSFEPSETASAASIVERALDPLETWLYEAADSPDAENRYVASAVALVDYAQTLLERVASGVEATHPGSAYATRARRAARALARRAQRTSDELLLVTQCDCEGGCSACGFTRGLAAVDLRKAQTPDTAS